MHSSKQQTNNKQTITWCETTLTSKEQSLQLGERLRKNYEIKVIKIKETKMY